jgi:crotonobetainyl-CoA:carnitine CoA-transferase CaiB-like acyl-CoA transferase
MMEGSVAPSPLPASQTSARVSGFLTGLRVIELGEGTAVGFCGRLLSDAGADVLKVEPPGGDGARRHGPFAGGAPHPERSLPFLVLHAGKRSLVLDPTRDADRRRLLELIRQADVVLDGSERRASTRWHLDSETLQRLNPGLVYAIVSPFGREGPYRGYRAEELTMYALGGLMYHIGACDREPLKHGPAQAAHLAGLNAAVGVVLALLARDHDGLGQDVDISAQAGVALLLGALELSQYAYTGGVARREEKDGPGLNNIQPCADGYVVPIAFGAAWEMLAHFLDEPALLEPRFATAAGRQHQMGEVVTLIRRAIADKGRFELFHGAQALGLTWGLVQGPADLVRCPQLAARGFWAEVEHPVVGAMRLPGPPYRASRTPARVRGPAPLLNQHGDVVHAWRAGASAAASPLASASPHPGLRPPLSHLRERGWGVRAGPPLAGVRVIDASRVWAMPLATGLLADMGAEVIKVEVPTYLDTRQAEPFLHNDPSERFWERSGIFNSLNRGKQSVTLNLATDEGKRLFRELVATADVLVENNRPGVLARHGLDYEALRAVRPDLIMLSNSGYGQTGPWRSYGAIALSLEPTTGLAHYTGYPGGPPVRWSWFTDFPACLTAVFAICGALYHRNRTGEGQFIDLAMYEVGVSLLGEELLDFLLNGVDRPRIGNRHPTHAPHGCYPCRGEDAWVTIAVTDEQEWRALCAVMGRPDLADDPRFATAAARKAHENELDRLIAAWTGTRDRYEIMHRLQAAGIAAGVVQTTRDLFADPQLAARGFFEWVDHSDRDPLLGVRPYVGRPWRLSRTPGGIRRRAPGLGEHNRTVLVDLLGQPDEALAAWTERGVIGEEPAEGTPVPEVTSPEERMAQGRWAAWDPEFERRLRDIAEGALTGQT